MEESRRREGQRPAGQQIGGAERQRRTDGAHARRGRERGDQEAHDQAPQGRDVACVSAEDRTVNEGRRDEHRHDCEGVDAAAQGR